MRIYCLYAKGAAAFVCNNPFSYLYMKDYLKQLDNILSATGEKVLQNAGRIKHSEAMKKVDAEYKKYQRKTITPVEAAYLESLKKIEKDLSKKK